MNPKATYPFMNPAGGQDWAEVVPSDSVTFERIPDALWIGETGDVEVEGTTSTQVFKNVPVGILPISPKKVMATGTTATHILALYYK